MADAKDLFEEMISEDKRLKNVVYVKDGHIIIDVEYEYEIGFNRCDTHEKIIAWYLHLSEKTWMTPEVMERFIIVALGKAGLNIPTV